MKDKKDKGIKRWRFTYKFLIINEKTLEEVFNLKLSRLTAVTYFCATLVVVFALMSVFIIYTPVKYFLPGFSDISVRSNLTREVIKIDSLANHIRLQDLQIQTMKNIISGSVPIDSIPEQQEITPEKWEELASKKSKFEQKFIEEYESGANYYPSIALEKTAAKPKLFSTPVLSGEILKSFNETQSGIEIAVKTGQRVSAVGAGTIVFSSFTLDNGYLVAIQHDNGYVSIYKNLSQLLKNIGESVATGEVIAVVGSAKNAKTLPLIFELWYNGKAINPEEIVIF